MAFRELATVANELDPCDIEIVDEVFAVLIPNVLATCPTVTVPEPTVPPGVMLVTDLKTLELVTVAPSPPPARTSVTEFPAISLPTIVKDVDD